jgi:putative SOS response-associated peptidase YedK
VCGRYNVLAHPVARLIEALAGTTLDGDRYNVAPTESVPVLRVRSGDADGAFPCELTFMRWWLVPFWSEGPSQQYAMFNARSETVVKSRAYREPFRRRRCVLPASGFVEWQATESGKQPYQIRPAADDGLLLAGVWDRWEGGGEVIESCSILTTRAHPSLAFLHARMPVLLGRDELDPWLAPDPPDEVLLAHCTPALPDALVVEPLSRTVNDARNKTPACAEPLEAGRVLEAAPRSAADA